jgi:hypothetical protein
VIEKQHRGRTMLCGLGDLRRWPVAQIAPHQHRLAAHIAESRIVRREAVTSVDQRGAQARATLLVAVREPNAIAPPAHRARSVQADRGEQLPVHLETGRRVAIGAHRELLDADIDAHGAKALLDLLRQRALLFAARDDRALADALCDAVGAARQPLHVLQYPRRIDARQHPLLLGRERGMRRQFSASRQQQGERAALPPDGHAIAHGSSFSRFARTAGHSLRMLKYTLSRSVSASVRQRARI